RIRLRATAQQEQLAATERLHISAGQQQPLPGGLNTFRHCSPLGRHQPTQQFLWTPTFEPPLPHQLLRWLLLNQITYFLYIKKVKSTGHYSSLYVLSFDKVTQSIVSLLR